MAVLTPGQTVRSREPTLRVENPFEPGTYRFRLVVIDDERNASQPADLVVRVVPALAPSSPVLTGPTRPASPLRPDRPTMPVMPSTQGLIPRPDPRSDRTETEPGGREAGSARPVR